MLVRFLFDDVSGIGKKAIYKENITPLLLFIIVKLHMIDNMIKLLWRCQM
jgi:hypothetical protein